MIVNAILEIRIDLYISLYAGNGIIAHAHSEKIANAGMRVEHVLRQADWGSPIRPRLTRTLVSELSQVSGVFSERKASDLSADSQGTSWDVEDFIKEHKLVRKSGKNNFECCKIPIPTAIRHDRIRKALGEDVTL